MNCDTSGSLIAEAQVPWASTVYLILFKRISFIKVFSNSAPILGVDYSNIIFSSNFREQAMISKGKVLCF